MAKRAVSRYSQTAQDDNRLRNILIAAGIVITIALLALLLFLNVSGPRPIRDAVVFGRQTRGHDESIIYPDATLPPVGGTHSPVWQNCGIYTEPVATQNAIHSLEHGAVWIAYNPDNVSERDIGDLVDVARGNSYILLAPYPNLDGNVVVTAWGVQLILDGPDGRVQRFVDLYLGQGPERGAACSGGIGTPG